MSTHVAWMLNMQVQPGRLEALKALMAEMADATRANEPGTLDYEWSLSADGSACDLFERYEDSDSALIHMSTFGAQYAERFFAVLTPQRFTLYGAPNEAVMAGLAPMGAVFMAPAAGFSR